MTHTSFVTMCGLYRGLAPMRLYDRSIGQTLDEVDRAAQQAIESEDV